MTYESNCTLPNELLAQIANEGLVHLGVSKTVNQ